VADEPARFVVSGSVRDEADESRDMERRGARPVAPGPGMPDPPPILAMIASLLQELQVDAEVLECAMLPSNDQYAALLSISREVSKAVLLPRRTLERAFVDPVARRRLRILLRAAVEALSDKRAISDGRLTPYFTVLKCQSWTGPTCALCNGPLLGEDPVVVHGTSRWHLSCPPAW
jgi:hypothetical protein